MKSITLILIPFLIMTSNAVVAGETATIKFGIGTDITTYFLDGYCFNVAGVFKQFELGLGFSNYNEASWMHGNYIDGASLQDAYLSLKYNFGENVTKPFLELGSLYGVTDVNYRTNSKTVEFRNTLIYGSIGYNIRISGHFRLAPSLSAGLIVAGEMEKTIEGLKYALERYVFGGAIGLYYYF